MEDLDLAKELVQAKNNVVKEIQKVIIGQNDVIEDLLVALFSKGHCLFMGVPGLAKTLLVSTLAQVLKLKFSRIQFTPDLMPSDITGTDILHEDHATGKRSFEFIKGPVFSNIILADEINRTPPKTQAALLQAMQDIITKDNVTVKVNAVVYFRVVDPRSAIIEVEDFLYATSQLSQTTLRSILGQSQLDDLLSRREEINSQLQQVIDQQTEPWGVKVANVEVKNVDLPQEMQRALAKQAEAERERRAKVINAQGEFEAAQKLSEAADQIGAHPPALQLRFLQTLVDMSTERSTTTFVPIPMDLFNQFQNIKPKKDE